MADTTLVLADVRNKVYEELGSPAQDLPNAAGGTLDDKIDLAARYVLRQVAQQGTGEDARIGTITTVDGQQTYAVPDDQDILEVFWGPSGLSDVDLDPYARQFGQIPGSSLVAMGDARGFYWRSDQLSADIKEKQIESRYRWEVIDGDLYLYPVPTAALTVRYIYASAAGDVTSLDIEFELAVIYLAASFGARVIANSVRGAGVPYTTTGVTEREKSQEWDSIADRYFDWYVREISQVL